MAETTGINFLRVLEHGMSKSKVWQGSASGENSPPACRQWPSHHVVTWSFIRARAWRERNLFPLFLKSIYLFLETGEGREKERKRNISWLPLVCALTRDPNPNPWHVPWLGMELETFCFACGMTPNQLSSICQDLRPLILSDKDTTLRTSFNCPSKSIITK